ncbi:ubiquinone/menaquinone biosynthesis methyltransferase [Omnitrophica bacterium]|nr:ubiquinone/menaquinone biosynthesis methyltransferase [Candidatus Omnitrophota bacterium]
MIETHSTTPAGQSSGYEGQPEKGIIRRYFNSIADRYDFLNALLSFRLDEGWRRKACDQILERQYKSILDLGTGTGKFLRIFLQKKRWDEAVGVDFSERMLEAARQEFLDSEAEFVCADFHQLPFEKESFDLVVSSFTLRSVQNVPGFLGGVFDLIKPGGKAAFLCLTRPKSVWWNLIYYPYLKLYLPVVGGWFSGNPQAYQFLSASIRSFQDPAQTRQMMLAAGFEKVTLHPFSFGMATLIQGKKPVTVRARP